MAGWGGLLFAGRNTSVASFTPSLIATISVRVATAVRPRHPESPASSASRRVTTTCCPRDLWMGGMSGLLNVIGRGLRSRSSDGSVEPGLARYRGAISERAQPLLSATDRQVRPGSAEVLAPSARLSNYRPCSKHIEQEVGRRSRADGDNRRVANKGAGQEGLSGLGCPPRIGPVEM